MNFYLPTRIITGTNCIKANSGLITVLGKRCMIVTGKSSAVKCGALSDVTDALREGCEYFIYNKIEQNPTLDSCIEGGELAKEFGAEFIIGIGGGSPLDAAKAIAVFATNDLTEAELYSGKWENTPLPVIAVGTTAGTGSEVTQVAVITASDGKKKSFRSDGSFPVIAFGDTRYTAFMPDRVARSTAVDALAHCTESYFCKSSTDISRMYALRGAKLIIDVLKKIVKGESFTDKMREELYIASLYGGVAISVTGTAFPHALGYFLTELHSLSHGEACAVYLPEFIEYNSECAPKLYKEFCDVTGVDAKQFSELITKVLPIDKIDISETEFDTLRERWQTNKCLTKLYREHTPKELENIVRKCVASR